MSISIQALEEEVLRLPTAERSRLLERIAVSLQADPDIEADWDQEADRRESEIDSGVVELIPGEEALARLRAKLR